MKKSIIIKDVKLTSIILAVCFVICLVLHKTMEADTLIPAIFVLGSFLVSAATDGYIYGIVAALISVVAVNYAFTFPFFKFSFTVSENLLSTIIMIAIAVITSALTTKLKVQETVRAENEKVKTRSNLLRAISHDLRTPLTTIYGSSSALIENKDNFTEEQKEQILKGISQDAQWLSRMVENLLSITKLDNGNMKITKIPTAVDELIDSVLIKFSNRYPDCNVIVEIPDEFTLVPMDPMLIEQVIINILENAVHHATGMTKLSLKVFVSPKRAVFQIKDNGCGIPDKKLKTLFTGIYAGEDEEADSKRSNAGIGLSVCASIIKAHGGEIEAQNLRHGGAVFRFSLDMMEEAYE